MSGADDITNLISLSNFSIWKKEHLLTAIKRKEENRDDGKEKLIIVVEKIYRAHILYHCFNERGRNNTWKGVKFPYIDEKSMKYKIFILRSKSRLAVHIGVVSNTMRKFNV